MLHALLIFAFNKVLKRIFLAMDAVLCRLGHHYWTRVDFDYEMHGPLMLRQCCFCKRREAFDEFGFSGHHFWRRSNWPARGEAHQAIPPD